MRSRIGILDRDCHYARCLMEYINLNYADSLFAVSFSDSQSLNDYLNSNCLELLITYKMPANERNVRGCVSLCEYPQEGELESIYKYQSVRLIVKNIKKILETQSQLRNVQDFFTCVASPIGRCGKTEFALGICNLYSESLYIGMEMFPGEVPFGLSAMRSCDTNGLSERFAYYLASHNENMLQLFEGANSSSFSLIYLELSYQDIRQFNESDFTWFRELMKSQGSFKRIVIDMAMPENLEVFTAFDRVYIPALTDETSSAKIAHFIKANKELLNENTERILTLSVPNFPYNSDEMKNFITLNVL